MPRILQVSAPFLAACLLMSFTAACDIPGVTTKENKDTASKSDAASTEPASEKAKAPEDIGYAKAETSAPSVGADGQPLPFGKLSQDGAAVVEAVSLKRTDGDTMTLKFNVRNNANESKQVTIYSTPNSHMSLMDLTNRRRYIPGSTSDSMCFASSKEVKSCWAIFAAPPPEVQKMTVAFSEATETFVVPITP